MHRGRGTAIPPPVACHHLVAVLEGPHALQIVGGQHLHLGRGHCPGCLFRGKELHHGKGRCQQFRHHFPALYQEQAFRLAELALVQRTHPFHMGSSAHLPNIFARRGMVLSG